VELQGGCQTKDAAMEMTAMSLRLVDLGPEHRDVQTQRNVRGYPTVCRLMFAKGYNMPLSSSGLGRWPFKPVARVRIPLGVRIWIDQWRYLRSLKGMTHIREMTWEQWKKSAPNADFRPMTSIMKDSTE
jgi:hypothetical protein